MKKQKKRFKLWHKLVLTLILILAIVLMIVSYALFNFSFRRGGFSSQIYTPAGKTTQWYDDQKTSTWNQTSYDGIHLKAHFIPAAQKTNKTMIVVHGYGGSARKMSVYLKMFHDQGYNVLAPDNRSYGQSGGEYSGFGWQDRKDVLKWIDILNQKQPNSEIGMYGISMGASTVLYTLNKVPSNVKFAVADCGYATISGELKTQLEQKFNLPSFPLLQITDQLSKYIAGYKFTDADTKDTLKNNHVPLFIIHGKNDDFVPVKNAYTNYRNDDNPKKQLWLVDGAEHAQSYIKQPVQYSEKVGQFANKYFK